MHRGTLRSDKDNEGRVYVYLTPDDTQHNGVNTSDSDNRDTGVLDELRDRIRFLEGELEDRKEENRRKDAILMTLAQRVPELEASPEPGQSPTAASNGQEQGSTPPVAE